MDMHSQIPTCLNIFWQLILLVVGLVQKGYCTDEVQDADGFAYLSLTLQKNLHNFAVAFLCENIKTCIIGIIRNNRAAICLLHAHYKYSHLRCNFEASRRVSGSPIQRCVDIALGLDEKLVEHVLVVLLGTLYPE